MHTLIIETSTEKGLVALFKDKNSLETTYLPEGLQNSKHLVPEIQRILQNHKLQPQDIHLVVTGIGPGSYTGIRVGAITAKTFAHALNIPLIGISTLQCFTPHADGTFYVAIDARIGGIYCIKGIRSQSQITWLTPPQALPLPRFLEQLEDNTTILSPQITSLQKKIERNVQWIETPPNPAYIIEHALQKLHNQEFSTDARLELLYLRKTQAEIEREMKQA